MALRSKRVATFSTRPSAIGVSPESGATPASRMAAIRAGGPVRSPCQILLTGACPSGPDGCSALGGSSSTRSNVSRGAITGPLGGAIWSMESFSRLVVVPPQCQGNVETTIASVSPGRRSSGVPIALMGSESAFVTQTTSAGRTSCRSRCCKMGKNEVRIVAASASGVDRQSLCAASKQMPSSVSFSASHVSV